MLSMDQLVFMECKTELSRLVYYLPACKCCAVLWSKHVPQKANKSPHWVVQNIFVHLNSTAHLRRQNEGRNPFDASVSSIKGFCSLSEEQHIVRLKYAYFTARRPALSHQLAGNMPTVTKRVVDDAIGDDFKTVTNELAARGLAVGSFARLKRKYDVIIATASDRLVVKKYKHLLLGWLHHKSSGWTSCGTH